MLVARLRAALRSLSGTDSIAARREFSAVAGQVSALILAGAIPLDRARELVGEARRIIADLQALRSSPGRTPEQGC